MKAPNFKLSSTSGKTVELNKVKSKYIIIYFYPKDDTPGCTKEALEFSNLKNDFDKILKRTDGLSIVYYKPLYGDLIALLWDIGFRPLFKPLYEMSKNLNKTNYIKIKKQLVNTIYNLSKHYIVNYKPQKPFFSEAMEYAILIRKNEK